MANPLHPFGQSDTGNQDLERIAQEVDAHGVWTCRACEGFGLIAGGSCVCCQGIGVHWPGERCDWVRPPYHAPRRRVKDLPQA